jgi:hypothetical protein
MPQLIGELQFIGSLQNLSAYKMRGSDKIILRKKGGPTKKQIQRSPKFELTRRNNMEFGGRSKAAAHIKRILRPLLFLADYNITGPLNALLKPIQKMDPKSEWGKRNVLVSKNPRLLEGFTLNRRNLLESIVSAPFSYSIQKQQGDFAWYRITAVAGLVPDLFYSEHGYITNDRKEYFPEFTDTGWLPVNTPAPAGKLIIQGLPAIKPDSCSMMIAVGIAFGTIQRGEIERVKYIGGGKVIGME